MEENLQQEKEVIMGWLKKAYSQKPDSPVQKFVLEIEIAKMRGKLEEIEKKLGR